MKRLYESVGSPGSGQWKRTRVLNSGSAASSHLRCGHRIWLWILSRVSPRCRPAPSLLAVHWCVLNSISLVLSQLLAAPSECVPQQSATGEGREIHLQKVRKVSVLGSRKPQTFPSCLLPLPSSSFLSSSLLPKETDLVLRLFCLLRGDRAKRRMGWW